MQPGTDALKRFEEIKNMYNEQKHLLRYEDVEDLIQMVNLLIQRNQIEYGKIKELSILFKDERILKLKLKVQKVTIKNDKTLECEDVERKKFFVFNLNEIIYFTLEKVGE